MRLFVLGSMLLSTILAVGVPRSALAIIGPCNDCPASVDPSAFGPIVYVDDGTTVSTGVTVYDSPYHIQAITYTIHVPVGQAVTRYSFQGSQQTSQNLTIVADQPAGTYAVDALVTDAATSAIVYGQTNAKNTGSGLCGSGQVEGAANTLVSTTATLAVSCGS